MKGIIIPILLFMVNAVALAQTSFSVDVSTYYDDNLYRSPEAESDFLSFRFNSLFLFKFFLL